MTAKHNVKLAALIVMFGIFLSRILGFFREMLIANTFGRSIQTDAFYAAFTIPDLMFYLLIGGTLSAAFIPVFTSYLVKDNEKEGWAIASNFSNFIFVGLLILTVLGIIFAPYIVPLVAYGFKGEQLELTIRLTRIMFPAVAFTCLAGLQGGILNSYQKFAVAAIGPIVYNIGIIISLLILRNNYGIEAIAYGVVASAFANFMVQAFALSDKYKYYSLVLDKDQEGLKKIIGLAIPSIIGLSISQLNLIITQSIASGFDEGSITAIRYANVMMSLPVGIFAMGISTAVFPTLTRQIALDTVNDYKETFSLSIRTIFFVTIPAAIGLIVLREPIIRLLFGHGQFNEYDVQVTAYALLFFSMGIAFSGGVQLLTRGFYSIQDTITPVKLGAITVIANIILNFLFVSYLPVKYSVGALTLASSITAIINMLMLILVFNKKIKGLHLKRILKSVIKTTISASLMGLAIMVALNGVYFDITVKIEQLKQVSFLIAIGILVFGIFTMLLKMEEVQYLSSLIKNKIKFSSNNNA